MPQRTYRSRTFYNSSRSSKSREDKIPVYKQDNVKAVPENIHVNNVNIKSIVSCPVPKKAINNEVDNEIVNIVNMDPKSGHSESSFGYIDSNPSVITDYLPANIAFTNWDKAKNAKPEYEEAKVKMDLFILLDAKKENNETVPEVCLSGTVNSNLNIKDDFIVNKNLNGLDDQNTDFMTKGEKFTIDSFLNHITLFEGYRGSHFYLKDVNLRLKKSDENDASYSEIVNCKRKKMTTTGSKRHCVRKFMKKHSKYYTKKQSKTSRSKILHGKNLFFVKAKMWTFLNRKIFESFSIEQEKPFMVVSQLKVTKNCNIVQNKNIDLANLRLYFKASINEQDIVLNLDCGADISLFSTGVLEKYFGSDWDEKLKTFDIEPVFAANETEIPLLRIKEIPVEINSKTYLVKAGIFEGTYLDNIPLLSRAAMFEMMLGIDYEAKTKFPYLHCNGYKIGILLNNSEYENSKDVWKKYVNILTHTSKAEIHGEKEEGLKPGSVTGEKVVKNNEAIYYSAPVMAHGAKSLLQGYSQGRAVQSLFVLCEFALQKNPHVLILNLENNAPECTEPDTKPLSSHEKDCKKASCNELPDHNCKAAKPNHNPHNTSHTTDSPEIALPDASLQNSREKEWGKGDGKGEMGEVEREAHKSSTYNVCSQEGGEKGRTVNNIYLDSKVDKFLDLTEAVLPFDFQNPGHSIYHFSKHFHSPYVKEKICEFMKKYESSFSRHSWDVGPGWEGVEQKIKFIGPVPQNKNFYKLKGEEEAQLKAYLLYLKHFGIIRESDLGFGVPIFFVLKANSQSILRIIFDFRAINQVIAPESKVAYYGSPEIYVSEINEKVRYLTKLDMTSAFYQIKVSEESIATGATNFICQHGCYSLLRSPTGLASTPALFNIEMAKILSTDSETGRYAPLEFVFNYSDDVMVGSSESEGEEGHMQKLETVFKRFQRAGAKVNISKSQICIDLEKDTVDILGATVGCGIIAPDPKKVETIQQLPYPKTVKDLQGFLGHLNYLRKLTPPIITHLLGIITPLVNSKPNEFFLEDHHKRAIDNIKEIIQSDLVRIQKPMQNAFLFIYSDSSSLSMGSCAFQIPIQDFNQDLFNYKELYENVENKANFEANKLSEEDVLMTKLKKIGISDKIVHGSNSHYNTFLETVICALKDLDLNPEYRDPKKLKESILDTLSTNIFLFIDFFEGVDDFIAYVQNSRNRFMEMENDYPLLRSASTVLGRPILLIFESDKIAEKNFLMIGSEDIHYMSPLILSFGNKGFRYFLSIEPVGSAIVNNFTPTIDKNTNVNKIYEKFHLLLKNEDAKMPKLRLVGYHAKLLGPIQKVEPIYSSEALAILEALEHFKQFIDRSPITILLTDSTVAFYMFNAKICESVKKFQRYSLKLSLAYPTVRILPIPGKNNIADYLSRFLNPTDVNDLLLANFSQIHVSKPDCLIWDKPMSWIEVRKAINDNNEYITFIDEKLGPKDIIGVKRNKTMEKVTIGAISTNRKPGDISSNRKPGKEKKEESIAPESVANGQDKSENIIFPEDVSEEWWNSLTSMHMIIKYQREELLDEILNIGNDSKYILQNEILLYKDPTSKKFKIVIPSKYLDLFVLKIHKIYKHQGKQKLYSGIDTLYHFANISKTTVKNRLDLLISSCFTCLTTKANSGKQNIMGATFLPDKPGEALSLDLIEDLPSQNGYKHLCVIIDLFSRYAIGIPLSSKKGHEILRAITIYMQISPGVKFILTDNGAAFNNSIVKKFLRNKRITIQQSTPMASATRGTIERLNRTIQTMIITDIKEEKRWLDLLPDTFAIYNMTTHNTTKAPPMQVHLGHQIYNTMLDEFLEPENVHRMEFMSKILKPNEEECSQKIRQQIHEKMIKEREKLQISRNKHRIEKKIAVGMHVISKNFKKNVSSKLNTKYDPIPYKVLKVGKYTVLGQHFLTNVTKLLHKNAIKILPIISDLKAPNNLQKELGIITPEFLSLTKNMPKAKVIEKRVTRSQNKKENILVQQEQLFWDLIDSPKKVHFDFND